ncbi:hypothetical protein [Flavobacterium alkalisoli]|uniref:hypothetical protein n=1 Tax=Flavobacterium alkalisoli TaxID=2602769 RepID=UPI003A8F9973
MKKLLAVIVLISLTSCATITNKRTYPLKVNTNAQNATVKIYDSIYTTPAEVKVKRSIKPLEITLNYDTISRVYKAKSRLTSKAYAFNLIVTPLYPESLLVDVVSQKGFYYGNELFLDINDTLDKAIKLPQRKKRDITWNKNSINIDISIPYVNGFLFQPEGEGIQRGLGFFGISTGVEYFYKNNKFVKLNVGGITNFDLPFPVPITNDGDVETFTSVYTTLTDNYQLKRFSLGYGLSYTNNRWHYNYGDDNYTNEKNKNEKSKNIGLSLNAYYDFGKTFHVGFIYNPTLVSVYPQTELLYQHTISFEILWKIRIKK